MAAFFAVGFLAVDFLAVVFRATGFAVVLFAVVLVPFLFVGMIASPVTLTLGSTCLDDYRRRGDTPWRPWAIVISAAEAALFGFRAKRVKAGVTHGQTAPHVCR